MHVFAQPLRQEQDVFQIQFQLDYSWFEFRVFLFLDWLPTKVREFSLP